MTNHIEREFKWTVHKKAEFDDFAKALRSLCKQVTFLKPLHITDYYLEDTKGSLSAHKIALRMRHAAGNWEVTFKTRSCLKNGLASRREITKPLPGVHTFRAALSILKQYKKWQGIDLTTLQVRFVIKNLRRLYKIVYKQCVCEAALDEYITLAKGHQFKRREIELELKKGPAKMFVQLAKNITNQTHLNAAKCSKVAGAEKWISGKLD